jgi:2-oxoglutarate/2-oxoacid ferredoxin oxidoreductase subunit alpha
MVIGAAYAGARSMTATSGGGFSLMVEGLGLAAITETPIVLVNAQRPGPATGLPTRTAQADLMFAIWASQDEFPRFVFAPGDPAEAFEATVRAFQLSDRFQVPAIVLTDQYLNDSSFTLQRTLQPPDKIERHLATDADVGDTATYQRYAITESGISPRVLPCQGEALSMSTGNEHTPDGHISEDATNRRQMVDKRSAKIPAMTAEMRPPETDHPEADTLLVGWGSSRGAIREAAERLRKEGTAVGCVHFCDLWPFPQAAVEELLGGGKRFIVVEGNSTAQLGLLIRQQTGLQHAAAVLKYDGRPFRPNEIMDEVRPLMS